MKLLLFIILKLISHRKDKKMKPGVIVAFFAISLSILSPQLYAENITDKLSYDGQIRLRSELDWKSFNLGVRGKSSHDLRTRLGFKFEPSEKVMVYIQLQDSRRLGYRGSGSLLSIKNFDMHQGYFVIQDMLVPGLCFKGGRFEVNYGNQRVLGSVGWHNIGRSWDGLLISYNKSNIHIDIFDLIKQEGSDIYKGADFDILGLYASHKRVGLDLFIIYELDSNSFNRMQERLRRFNLGGYFSNKYQDFDFIIQGNFQFGEKPRGLLPDSLIIDISALMINAEIGYTFKTSNPLRLAAGIDYTSGDDGSDTTKFTAYQNDYYTGHAFRGYMDYFIGSPDHGLVDLMVRGNFKYQKDWVFKGDFHYFQAAEYYQSKSDVAIKTKDVGIEIDLTAVNNSVEGATFTGGFSLFFADKHYAVEGDNRDPGLWGYFMTTINF
jgi:hypothetical protein